MVSIRKIKKKSENPAHDAVCEWDATFLYAPYVETETRDTCTCVIALSMMMLNI